MYQHVTEDNEGVVIKINRSHKFGSTDFKSKNCNHLYLVSIIQYYFISFYSGTPLFGTLWGNKKKCEIAEFEIVNSKLLWLKGKSKERVLSSK